MRVYFPLLSSDLESFPLVERVGFVALPDQESRGEVVELLEDSTQLEAALESLILLQDAPEHSHRRIVVAVDIPEQVCEEVAGSAVEAEGGRIIQVRCTRGDLGSPAAFLVDGEDAVPLVSAVLDAKSQEEADLALEHLWEEDLEWYDPAEVPILKELFLRS